MTLSSLFWRPQLTPNEEYLSHVCFTFVDHTLARDQDLVRGGALVGAHIHEAGAAVAVTAGVAPDHQDTPNPEVPARVLAEVKLLLMIRPGLIIWHVLKWPSYCSNTSIWNLLLFHLCELAPKRLLS